MRLKVLHIITRLELGGAQKHVLAVLSHLDPADFELHLISSEGILSAQARCLPRVRLTLSPLLRRRPNLLLDFIALLFLFFYIKRYKISIVHTHSSKAGILGRWAAKMAGVPVIVHTIHGWGFHDYFKNFLNDFYITLERLTAKVTTTLIAVSQSDIQKGVENGIGNPEQYRLIRYGIEQNDRPLPPDAVENFKHELGLGEGKVVGMVACLKPQKNPMDFVSAAEMVLERCPEAKFLIAGDGILRHALQKEIQRRNRADQCLLLGWRQDIFAVLSVCDVVVLTSLWEGLPVAFLEAMSLAKPVVAYDVSGLNEIVKDGFNGFLVFPRNMAALAEKISFLLENRDLSQRMGKLGKVFVTQDAFTTSAMVRQIKEVYAA